MLLPQQPVPGNWYTNEIGQLLYVRAILFDAGHISCIAFEHANGKRIFMDWQTWSGLSLVLHSQRTQRRSRVGDM